MKTIEELGRWEGQFFIFEPPITLPDGHVMKKVGIADDAFIAEGLSTADVITALGNSIAVLGDDESL